MNNPSASTNDKTISLSDSSSDIEIEDPKKTVSFTSNAEKINQLVKTTSTNTSLKVKRETIDALVTPSSAEFYDATGNMVKPSDGPWIQVKNKSKRSKVEDEGRWGFDDDEMTDADIEIEQNRKENQKREIEKMAQSTSYKMTKKRNGVANPYKRAENRKTARITPQKPISSLRDNILKRDKMANEKVESTIHAYLSRATQNKRQLLKDGHKVRIKFSHTPSYGTTNPHEALVHVMSHLKYIDPQALILPWDESNQNHSGPIASADLTKESTAIARNDLKFYADVPASTIQEGYTQGIRIWNMQVHINTTIEPAVFKDVWASKKGDIVSEQGTQYMSITLSCIQDAPKSVLIGVAQGSTEGINDHIINKKLETIVGIPGIRVSYQNIHQPGISKNLWDNANRKADATNARRNSRDYLDKKYAWAPEGLAVYVNNEEIADEARKKMMTLYGSTDDNGVPPVWPGGECMRFIPLKSSFIKSDKTRAKVDRRFKLHVYLKAQERTIITKFRNINEMIKDDMTFQEYILSIRSEQVDDFKLFRHFKKIWTPDPTQVVWALSVHKSMLKEAEMKVATLDDAIQEEFGPEIYSKFIYQAKSRFGRRTTRYQQSKANTSNDDDWFNDDDDEVEMFETKGIIIEGYEDAFAENHKDEESEDSIGSSWQFGSTTTDGKSATTILSSEDNTQNASGETDEISSITTSIRTEEITNRIQDVVSVLCAHHQFNVPEIHKVTNSISPFQPFNMMIHSTTYNREDTIATMCNLRKSNTTSQVNLPPERIRYPSPTEDELYE